MDISENKYNSIKIIEGTVSASFLFNSGVELKTIEQDKKAEFEDHITAAICKNVHSHIGGRKNITTAANGTSGVTEYPNKE